MGDVKTDWKPFQLAAANHALSDAGDNKYPNGKDYAALSPVLKNELIDHFEKKYKDTLDDHTIAQGLEAVNRVYNTLEHGKGQNGKDLRLSEKDFRHALTEELKKPAYNPPPASPLDPTADEQKVGKAIETAFAKDGIPFIFAAGEDNSLRFFAGDLTDKQSVALLKIDGNSNALAGALGVPHGKITLSSDNKAIFIDADLTEKQISAAHDKFTAITAQRPKDGVGHAESATSASAHRFVSYGENGAIRDDHGKTDILKKGDFGDASHSAVRDLQTMLAYLNDGNVALGATGFNTKNGIDNDYGKRTEAAVRKFQEEHAKDGLKVTGIADADTRDLLAKDFAVKWNRENNASIMGSGGHIADVDTQAALHDVRVRFSKQETNPALIASVGDTLKNSGVKHAPASGVETSDMGKAAADLQGSGVGNGTHVNTDPRNLTGNGATVRLDSSVAARE